jgi:hypothetical protein
MDGKVPLQFALASIIEAIRRNPNKYNNRLLAHNISSSTTKIPTQESLPLHNEDYKTMILEESDKLYNTLLKELVSTIMDNTTADFKKSSSQSKLPWECMGEKRKIALLSARAYRLSYIQNLVLNALLFKSKIVMNRIMVCPQVCI